MKPSPLRPIGKAIVRIPQTYPHVYVARELITEPIIQLDTEPARPIPVKAVKKFVKRVPAPAVIPAPKKMMKKIGRAVEPVLDLIRAEQAQGQLGEAVPIERGNRFMDMFQMAGGIPTSQYLNLSELPGLATSTPELATTIRALPEGLVKPDRAFDDAWDKVKQNTYRGSFGEEYAEDFADENGLSKKDKKELIETAPVEVLVIEYQGSRSWGTGRSVEYTGHIVEINSVVYLDPWLPPYWSEWLSYIDNDDEKDEFDEITKNYFRDMYDRLATHRDTSLVKHVGKLLGIDIPQQDDSERLKLVKEYGKLLKQKGRKHKNYTRLTGDALRDLIMDLSAYPDKAKKTASKNL